MKVKSIDLSNQEKLNYIRNALQGDFGKMTRFIAKDLDPHYNFEGRFQRILIDGIDNFLKTPEINTIIIEASKRSGKTELTTIYTMLKIAAQNPNKRLLVVAGNRMLKSTIHDKFLRGIKCDRFKDIFGEIKIISSAQTRVILGNGFIVDFITQGSDVPTGEGYHFMIFEDYLTATCYRSRTMREHALQKIHDFFGRTQKDPPTKIIINNQRFGMDDLSEYIVDLYNTEKSYLYTRITIPYYFRDKKEYSLHNGQSIVFNEGDFCVPWFNEVDMKKTIIDVGGREAFEAQCQQSPIPTLNVIIDRKWLRYEDYNTVHQRNFDKITLSLDTAYKEGKEHDYSAIAVFGYSEGKHYLIRMYKMKYGMPELIAEFMRLYSFYKKLVKRDININGIIENKASGISLEQMLKGNQVYTDYGFLPNVKTVNIGNIDKRERLILCSVLFESGNVIFTKGDPDLNKWLPEFEHELLAFPNIKHDDCIDAMTLYLNNFISNPVKKFFVVDF